MVLLIDVEAQGRTGASSDAVHARAKGCETTLELHSSGRHDNGFLSYGGSPAEPNIYLIPVKHCFFGAHFKHRTDETSGPFLRSTLPFTSSKLG